VNVGIGDVGEEVLARLADCGVRAPRLLGEFHGKTAVSLWVQQAGDGHRRARCHEGIAQFYVSDGEVALELFGDSSQQDFDDSPTPLAEGSSAGVPRPHGSPERSGVLAMVQEHHAQLLDDIRDNGVLVAQCTHFDRQGTRKLLVRFYELSLPG